MIFYVSSPSRGGVRRGWVSRRMQQPILTLALSLKERVIISRRMQA
jgi:hypothetical protein